MKRFILFLFALAVIADASAQRNDYCVLKLQLNDSSAIAVRLDGHYFNKHTNSLTFDNVSPGSHYLDVYSLEGTGGKRERIFSGKIQLRAGRVHEGTVDLFHRSLSMHILPRNAQNEWGQVNQNKDDSKNVNSVQDIQPNEPQKSDRIVRNNVDDGSRSPDIIEPTSAAVPGSVINDLQARVDSLLTDTDKEALMKKELKDRRFTTAELRQMLHWLSFEDSRLSFAQWSYSRVEDQDQFPMLENVFENDESKKEFQKIFSGEK